MRAVKCEIWQGFVWINLDAKAPALKNWLGSIYGEVTWFDGLRASTHGSKILECNWKVAIEANIEVYHVTTVHPDTVSKSLDYRGSAHRLYNNGHSRMIVPNRGYDAQEAKRSVNDTEIAVNGLMQHVNVSYLLFPNHLTPGSVRSENGVPTFTLQMFWPLSIDRTLSEWYTMIPDWGDRELTDDEQNSAELYRVVMDEDTEMLDQIQKAMKSQVLEGFLTSYHERRIYHHEASIDKRLGIDRVREHMRIPQLLPTEE